MKISAKNATILINGSKFSTYATAYETTQNVNPVEATGFSDQSKNYLPTLPTAKITADLFWDAATGLVHDKLKTAGQTGNVTIIPESYAVGAPSLSLPYLQANYTPQGSVDGLLMIGTLEFESYGNNLGIENGAVLYQGTITNTTTGSSVNNLAASTGGYSAIAHIWTPTSTDTYAVKIQHSTDDSTWADLATFTISGDGVNITSSRMTGSGTVNQYRRIVATRTGAAGDSFGFTVVLYTY